MRTKAAGIFLVDNKGKILVGHPTGHKPNFWSIPKGKLDKGETPYEAAVRETFEECNVDLSDEFYYQELPVQIYHHKRKEITPFVVCEWLNDMKFEDFDVKCNSIVPLDRDWNAGKPEMDDFKWVTTKEARELLHETQVACLDDIERIYQEE